MKVKILKIDSKPFPGGPGEADIPYFWIRALRVSDDVKIQFGTKQGAGYVVNEVSDVELEKREGSDGRIRYFEVVD